jgi:hypothetical protein
MEGCTNLRADRAVLQSARTVCVIGPVQSGGAEAVGRREGKKPAALRMRARGGGGPLLPHPGGLRRSSGDAGPSARLRRRACALGVQRRGQRVAFDPLCAHARLAVHRPDAKRCVF